jgi:hypothetical protein
LEAKISRGIRRVLDERKKLLGKDWDRLYAATNTLYVTRQNNILFTILAQYTMDRSTTPPSSAATNTALVSTSWSSLRSWTTYAPPRIRPCAWSAS